MIGQVFSVRLFFIRCYAVRCASRGILSEMWGVRALYFIIGSIICVTSLIGILLPYFKFLDGAVEEKQHNSKNLNFIIENNYHNQL